MKTLIFALSTLVVLFANKIEDSRFASNESMNIENTMEVSSISSSMNVVKATHYRGEIIPVVQLITLDIFPRKREGIKVNAIENNGEIIPVVTLPELNIVATK